ncbi:hypothetical protein DBR32_03645 [Taibaiella sp. KBW10]|uniref:polysaccharide deacetylase family protein n=1 Tax=Taibaiella sp. KBW10 TaxID=2153357 RepID=UPI000F5AD1F5|nr:polysaccharide deacetylase family protein [Taibaiella sp. KBW10]RQO31910.1 hypothetical protein DBR32_03645 [Taibaiella sp. KBW10]
MDFPHQILIYCVQITTRLQYVLDWVFREQLSIDYKITYDKSVWLDHQGPKINYSETRLQNEDILIIPHRLIFETGETPQQLNVNRWKKSTILFYNQPGALVPFDLFSATFYLLSRYEEYLPHKKDKHGRYWHTNSVAAQYSFLQQPVVDEWIIAFKRILERKFNIDIPHNQFDFLPTYDIDIAWAYMHKSRKYNWGGALKDVLKLKIGWAFDRLIVTNSKRQDPYDAYAWMDDVHKFYNLQPMYFFLVGKNGPFDKNLDPAIPAMQNLIKETAAQYQVGLHPSYGSYNQPGVLQKELNTLQEIVNRYLLCSRQHYIKMALPDTYRDLIEAGIEEDYSMGYPTVNGFRAGTSQPFLWFDLSREEKTELRVHPFCFMETTAINLYEGSKNEAYQEVERLIMATKNVHGRFVSIFHNNNLGNGRENKGWHKFYQKMIELVQR